MPDLVLASQNDECVVFARAGNSVFLSSVFGIPCESAAPAVVRTIDSFFDAGAIQPLNGKQDESSCRIRYAIGNGDLELVSTWTIDAQTGIVSRRDSLRNTSGKTTTILRWLSRTALQPSRYELYTQSSRWATENQGAWTPAHAGTVVLGCEQGRTAQGASPYACIYDPHLQRGLAVHLIPRGNWQIRLVSRPGTHSISSLSIETGQADDLLAFALGAAESWDSPRNPSSAP